VKKPELTQEEWAYQGEYRVWSKTCASFYLPLWAENPNEVAEDCHTCVASHKKKPAYETLESFMRWLYGQQSLFVDG
jgi:hypothetical protein